MPHQNVLSFAAAVALCGLAPPALAQGALKPVDARIVNTPTQPVPVTVLSTPSQPGEGSREIYALATVLDFAGSFACTSVQTLPAGKRLVLQHLGGNAALFAPSALVHLSIRSPSGLPELVVPAAPPVTNVSGVNLSAAGQQANAYFDGDFEVCVSTSTISGSNRVSLSLRGYLVNKP